MFKKKMFLSCCCGSSTGPSAASGTGAESGEHRDAVCVLILGCTFQPSPAPRGELRGGGTRTQAQQMLCRVAMLEAPSG